MTTRFNIHVTSTEAHVEQPLPFTVIREINKVTSYELPDAWARGYGPQRVYLFRKQTQKFPSGLLKRVKKAIRRAGYKTKIIDYRKSIKINDKKVLETVDRLTIEPRWYQAESLIDGVQYPYGLFWHATGVGKSVLMAMLLNAYDCVSMVLTHRKELLYQLRDTISDITGREVGVIGDGHWEPRKWTVVIINSLFKEGNEDEINRFLNSIEYLQTDEVHRMGARTYIKISKKCKNTKARHGFSGTCFRTDNADLLLLAHTGDIISHYTTSFMIEDGWLARPYIFSDEINVKSMNKNDTWPQIEKELIVQNRERNLGGCKFIYEMAGKGKQVLVMVRRIIHGRILKEMLVNEFGIESRDIRYMNGEKLTDVRRRALQDFKYGIYPILIGTSIYDEGIDLPAVGAGVNMGGGDSDIKTTQKLGRILRKKKEDGDIDIDPNKEQIVYYYDPKDKGHRFIKKHSNHRYKNVYEKEPAFVLKGKYDAKKISST